tara:strand:+ start:17448 stop:17630 length:183 start_codon:yes stop_codon:yes gene_type:complete
MSKTLEQLRKEYKKASDYAKAARAEAQETDEAVEAARAVQEAEVAFLALYDKRREMEDMI